MSFRFAVSASFTAEPIAAVLEFWGHQLETPFEIRFAPYNQLVQTLLDSSGEFVSNTQGVNVLLVRLEDLGQFNAPDASTLNRIESNFQGLVQVIRSAPQYTSVPLIFLLCASSPQFLADDATRRFAHDMNLRAESMLKETPGIIYLSSDDVQRLYPVDQPFNPEGDRLAHIPYTDLYFAALGTSIVRMAHALTQPPFKVIALDCDNTLWKGICGEDGPRGIVVDGPRHALQTFMAEQRDQGMLLVLASKNNDQDVLDTFEQNPEMPLQLRHFIARRLDWGSKHANLVSLANQLSLGLDSFIFVDDNPRECAEVEESTPEVLALTLPERDADIPAFLDHIWAFDHLVVTEEDRRRNASYLQAQDFGRELKRAESMQHFLATLDLRVRFDSASEDRIARVAQLTQRTNQFNFSTIRRTEAEIRALISEAGTECLTIDVSDRFGEYGLTGVVVFRALPAAIEVETFLLSCRVLGRGVEHRVMAHLAEEALGRGLDTVVVRFRPTAKNEPANQFLRSIGHEPDETGANGMLYRLPAIQLRQLTWQPTAAERSELPSQAAAKPSVRKRPDYARIARKLSTPAQILEAARRESPQPTTTADITGSPMTDTESRLAGIWRELLRRPDVGLNDNFFDLGGHSLLVVLLLVRVRETFGAELAIDDVYAPDVTLKDLARKIEILQHGDAREYEALLKEIESMSDEEVARLLAEEDPGASRL